MVDPNMPRSLKEISDEARDADLIEDPDLLQASLEALEQRIATSASLTEGDAQAPQRLRRIEKRLAARAPEPPIDEFLLFSK